MASDRDENPSDTQAAPESAQLLSEENEGNQNLVDLEHRLEEDESRVMSRILEDGATRDESSEVPSDERLDNTGANFGRSSSLMSRNRFSETWAAQYVNEVMSYPPPPDQQAQAVIGTIKEIIHAIPENESGFHAQSMMKLSETVDQTTSAKRVMQNSGAIAIVTHVMALFHSSPEVQIAGCNLLQSTADDCETTQDKMGVWEGIDAVLDALTTHLANTEVQAAASGALRILTWGKCSREIMLRHGAMQDLVLSMNTHIHDSKLQERVSGTIAHVVFGSNDAKKLCGAVGGIKAVLNAMKRHPDDVSLQAQCCFAMRNLSWGCKENHNIMHEEKASQYIIDAMQRHPRIPGIHDQGLAALSNLMFRDVATFEESHGESSHAQKRCLHELAFNALHSFPKHVSVIRHAQSLLINLCDQLRTGHSQAIREVGCYPNAAKLICRSGHVENATIEVFRNAAKLLKVLCTVDEFLNGVRNNGGVEALLRGLAIYAEENPADASVLVDGINAACSGSDESKAHFNKLGGVLKISEFMHSSPSNEKFQERCCALLDIVSNGQFEATASSMAHRPEATRAILAACVRYLESPAILEHCCSVMIKIAAASEADSNDLCSAGAKPIVEKALTAHAGNPAVESLANQLLTLLVPTNEGREGRGVTPRGNASSRLRSRSRTVQTGQRSRSRMDRSKSRDRVKTRGGGLAPVDEESGGEGSIAPLKPTRHAGSKPERRNRRGGRAPITQKPALDALPE